ncbi:hypothetical protein E2C01_102195 [Portunus trituberculatus]|uniref:Uncharacterized protein n=1 Tax=Portunus trituberculatus TaxID=210409 RepID=A0A5B7KHT8_PORTR|nr:hypothetical protein [Portunus trituberculatus]
MCLPRCCFTSPASHTTSSLPLPYSSISAGWERGIY